MSETPWLLLVVAALMQVNAPAAPRDAFAAKAAEARALMGQGKAAEAIAAFEAAARLNPGDGPVRNALGSLLNMSGRYAEALVHAEAAVAADPGNGRYRYNRGVVLAEQGRFEEAVADFDAGIAAHPDNAYAHLERGAALLSLDRAAEARRDWAKARQVDPALVWTHWYEAVGDFVDARYGQAAAGFDRVAVAEPGFAAARMWRSLAHARAGTPVAVAAVAGEDWPAPVVRFLAGALSEEALLAAARADRRSGDARREGESLFTIGQKALAEGRRDAAAARFRAALAVKAPRHAWKIAAERELAALLATGR